MKNFNLLKSATAVTLMACSMLSCQHNPTSTQELLPEDPNTSATKTLMLELESYNANFVDPNGAELRGRGFWSWLGRVVCVIASDAIGTVVGVINYGPSKGLEMGINTSRDAAAELLSVSPTNNALLLPYVKNRTSDLLFSTTTGYSNNTYYAGQVPPTDYGYLHNQLLRAYLYQKPTYYGQTRSLSLLINQRLRERYGIRTINDRPSLGFDSTIAEESENIKSTLIYVMSTAETEEEIVGAIGTLVNCSADEADILYGYLKTLGQLDDSEVATYTSGYHTRLFSSEVNKVFINKAAIFTSVAANSKLLWQIN